jgi:hypothetical protein
MRESSGDQVTRLRLGLKKGRGGERSAHGTHPRSRVHYKILEKVSQTQNANGNCSNVLSCQICMNEQYIEVENCEKVRR